MPFLPLALALLTLSGHAPVGAQESAPALLEVEAAPSLAYPGELVRVRARIALREDVLARSLVPIVPRALDLPVLLRAPWLEGLPDAVLLPATTELDTSLVLGGSEGRARRDPSETRDGVSYTVFVVEREFRFQHPGRVDLGPATLEYAVSGSQQRDPFGEPVARDVQRFEVRAAPAELRVQPLPEEGRPPSYGGLVGDLALSVSAFPRDVTVGGELTLVLTLAARDGSTLAGLPSPALPELRGLATLGMREVEPDAGAPPGARAFAYSLEVRDAALRELPAFELFTFLPTPPAHYAPLRTAALPLLVRASGPRADSSPPPSAGDADPFPPAPLTSLALAVLFLLVLGVLRRRLPPRTP